MVDDATEKDMDGVEDDNFEPPSPAPKTGFFARLRDFFGGDSQSDKERALNIHFHMRQQ